MTTATPTTADAFVARLLATDDADKRRALIERCPLQPDELGEAVERLLAEAERMISANPRRMEQICLDALSLAERAQNDFLWAMARFKHGEACTLQDRNVEARAYLDEAATTFTRLGRPVEAARTRIIWIWATAKLGEDQEAIAAARAARKVFATNGENLRLATLEHNVAIIHRMRARHAAALRRFRAAVALFDGLGEFERSARARLNVGLTLTRLGRYREALSELHHACEAMHALGLDADHAAGMRTIGECQMSIGRYTAALRTFEEVNVVFRSLGLHSRLVWSARDMADCYLHLERPADALAVLDDVEEHLRYVDRPTDVYAIAIRRVAAHLLLGERQAALAVLDDLERRVPEGDAPDRAVLAIQRATVLCREGSWLDALSQAREAGRLAHAASMRGLVADARLTEGVALFELGSIDDAENAAHHAHELARKLDSARLLHRTYELLGRVSEARDQEPAARRRYAAAIDQVEREQRGVIFAFRDSFAHGRHTVYGRLAALQVRAGSLTGALATAERAKSRALVDAMSGRVDLKPRGGTAVRRIARDLTKAREDYAAVFRYMGEGEQEPRAEPTTRERQARRLAELEVAINDLVRRLQLVGAKDDIADLYGAAPGAVLPAVPEDTTIIEFFFDGETILRFAVDVHGVRAQPLHHSVSEIERLLRVFHLNLAAAMCASSAQQEALTRQACTILQRLHDRLLGGLELADTCRSLVFVPHGLLHYLPFHALHDGTGYLIERFAVSYAPSALVYGICRERTKRPPRRTALVLAHSAGGMLPNTVAEAKAVATVLGTRSYQEAEATRALLERGSRRAGIVHLAAHGRFRPEAPLFSYLQLADGALTTADVFNLDLSADLVALSACETGRAVLGGGDELVGLSRAFLCAGTARLLVSHWRVDDGSTAELMSQFYQEIGRQTANTGYAAALRLAQLRAIRSPNNGGASRHPFSWAAFQLIGC